MAHVRKILELKFKRRLQREQKPQQLSELDRDRIERQKMIRMIIAA